VGLQAEGTKEGARQHCVRRREGGFQKKAKEILDNLKDGFTAVSEDESFFTFDSLVRRVWIYKDSRPVVRVTGSHQRSCLFGATSLDGRQLFRQYDWFDEDTFLDYLKQIHKKFPKCYLFLDKARQHHRSKKVGQYFEEHKDSLIPVWIPTASPEFMVLEACWKASKNDLLVLAYYPSFGDFKRMIWHHFRTKCFHFDMRKYLTGGVSA